MKLLVNMLAIWCLFLMVNIIQGNTLQADESRLIAKRTTGKTDTSCGGLPGLPGRDGRDGRDARLRGLPGKPGKAGPAGPPGPKGKAGGSTGGVVYTRWGRKHCPQTAGTNEIYSGVMGGSWYSHPGGGANYLCLSSNPIFDKTTSGNQGYSYIYGTEYEVSPFPNMFPRNVHNHDAPCAVCHTESRGSELMIPGRNNCPSGWVLEYKGYLMSAYHGHNGRTQFICVDANAEGTTGSHSDKNGALLYFVESYCGSLPCPPYATGKEVTCAVCTK